MNWRGLCLAAAALGALGLAAQDPEEPPTSARGEPAWSCQLHLHGSFSEGEGSIDSHSFEARDVHADVLWWSDHDFRIAYHRLPAAFSFDAQMEPVDADPLLSSDPLARHRPWLFERHLDRQAAGGWELVDDHVQGERSMRVWIRGQNRDFERRFVRLGSENSDLSRSLASQVHLKLAVRPGTTGPDAHAVVEVDLSEHPMPPVTPDSSLKQFALRYVIGGPPFEAYLDRVTYNVHVDAPSGEWSELTLDLTGDAERGFPSIAGRDNSMFRLGFGVEARQGTDFDCLFDDLRIEQAVPPERMYAVQRALIDQVAAGYPELREHQGVEISYVTKHLNEFSVGTELLDYEAIAAELQAAGRATPDDFADAVLTKAIEAAHARRGLISYNHMFGASWVANPKLDKRHETLREVTGLIHRGIDLLEVGYVERGGQRLSDHLWVWDELAAKGLPIVGTGVSDSHGGRDQRWRTGTNNFISWIYAPSTDKADLIEGLRAGRVFFGDLTVFDGALDILSDRGFVMGQVVLCDRDEVELTLLVRGAQRNMTLHVIENGQQVDSRPIDGPEQRHTMQLAASGPSFVRTELHTARKDIPKVFTNALHFVREAPATGIPAARAGLDFAGLVVVRFEGFDLLGAQREPDGSVLLRGTAENGRFRVDTTRFGPLSDVRLEGLQGTSEIVEGGLQLSGLAGTGTVRIRSGS